jgi:hypothetical protein
VARFQTRVKFCTLPRFASLKEVLRRAAVFSRKPRDGANPKTLGATKTVHVIDPDNRAFPQSEMRGASKISLLGQRVNRARNLLDYPDLAGRLTDRRFFPKV